MVPALVALWALLLLPSTVSGSFARDVLNMHQPPRQQQQQQIEHAHRMMVEEQLLAKAVPLSEYYASKGLAVPEHRALEENDDFYVDYNDRYSFSGYSLKYAKCQPVQYFSSDAIAAGEHSPMITEDIVILRLCPQSSCSASVEYGCHYNYAEYALAVGEYISIMLKYKSLKIQQMCEWCAGCGVVYSGDDAVNNGDDDAAQRRRLEDGGAGDDAAEDENGEEEEQEAEQDGDDYYQGDDGGNCYNVDSYCTEFNDFCGGDDEEEYANYEAYLDYMNCAEVEYNGYAYFVRPRCDGYEGTIKMAVYYDNYCGSYAGSEVSVKELGLGFKESVFNDFYTGECIDCSESNTAPYYNLNSGLCNRVHLNSAKCTSDLLYDVVGNADDDESSECSFIESLRFGTYDSSGKLSSGSNIIDWDTEVSPAQKALLAVTAFLCVVFVIYACYLHHSMTNLLIKSLSHRELLPPGRHRNRNSNNRGGGGGGEDDYKLV